MKDNLAIFYHLYQNEFSGLIYQQQMHRLHTSGLMDACEFIHIGIVGEAEMFSLPSPEASFMCAGTLAEVSVIAVSLIVHLSFFVVKII